MKPETKVAKANNRLKESGAKAKLLIRGKSLALQFTFEGKQYKKSVGKLSDESIKRAEQLALQVTNDLLYNRFSWENYPQWNKKEKALWEKADIKDLICSFEEHYWKTHERKYTTEASFKSNYGACLAKLSENTKLTTQCVTKIIETTKPNSHSRQRTIKCLKAFCRFCEFDFNLDKYQGNKPKASKKYVPTKEEIERDWLKFEEFKEHCRSWLEQRWIFSMMACYGLRNHECLSILNLYKEYRLNDGTIVPPFIERDSLAIIIGEDTKTGFRVNSLPSNSEWLKLFRIKEIPDSIPFEANLEERRKWVSHICRSNKDSFTKKYLQLKYSWYSLRDYYAIALRQKIDPTTAAQLMGHTLKVHEANYQSHISDKQLIELAQTKKEGD